MNHHVLKRSAAVLVVLLVLSMIPMLWVGVYDRMCYDDYSFSVGTKAVVDRGGSIGELLAAAADKVVQVYQDWQGTFSAVFVFALQPGIWSQQAYAVTPVLLIGVLVLGIAALVYAVCRYLLGIGKTLRVMIFCMAVYLCVQFPRDAAEGFYWYNGGMFYTFFYGLLLMLTALGIAMVSDRTAGTGVRALRGVTFVMLAAILSGSSYPTALLEGVLLTGAIVWAALQNKKMLPYVIAATVLYLIGFYFNVTSPGNANRQAYFEQMSPIGAILASIAGVPKRMGGQFLRHRGLYLTLLLVWAPFCIVCVRGAKLRFRWPLAVPVISWLLLAVMFTPPFYATGSGGPDRLWDIVCYTFALLLMFNLYYFAGWFRRKAPVAYEKVLDRLLRYKRLAPAYLAVTLLLFLAVDGLGAPLLLDERGKSTSVYAIEALADGSAKRIAALHDAQIRTIEETEEAVAYVAPFQDKLAFMKDTNVLISPDAVAEWFGKEDIREIPQA